MFRIGDEILPLDTFEMRCGAIMLCTQGGLLRQEVPRRQRRCRRRRRRRRHRNVVATDVAAFDEELASDKDRFVALKRNDRNLSDRDSNPASSTLLNCPRVTKAANHFYPFSAFSEC